MPFFFLMLIIFCMYFQPVAVFPALAPYSPLKVVGILAFISFFLLTPKKKPFFHIREFRFFLLFCLMQVVSASFIWLQRGLAVATEWLKGIVAVYLIYQLVTTLKRLRLVVATMLAGITYLSYYSITAYIRNYTPGLRAWGFGWFDAANDVGLALVVAIPLTVLFSDLSKGLLSKSYLILLPLFSVNTLLTGSRNVLIGLLVVVIGSVFISRNINCFFKKIIVIVVVLAVITFGIKIVLQRTDLHGLTGDASSENRIVQWEAAARILADHPFLGIGPDEFISNAADYGGIRGLAPHNTLVQAFAETGIIGGMFFFLMNYYLLRNAWLFFLNIKACQEYNSGAVVVYKHLIVSFLGFWLCAFFSNRISGHTLYICVALTVAVRENILPIFGVDDGKRK